jgi:hypothetical protein
MTVGEMVDSLLLHFQQVVVVVQQPLVALLQVVQ